MKHFQSIQGFHGKDWLSTRLQHSARFISNFGVFETFRKRLDRGRAVERHNTSPYLLPLNQGISLTKHPEEAVHVFVGHSKPGVLRSKALLVFE